MDCAKAGVDAGMAAKTTADEKPTTRSPRIQAPHVGRNTNSSAALSRAEPLLEPHCGERLARPNCLIWADFQLAVKPLKLKRM